MARSAPRPAYVVDTNVLLHEAHAIHAFPDGDVVITVDVLEELDNFKSKPDELGRTARRAIRILDELRSSGALAKGVPLPNGGMVQVIMTGYLEDLPSTMDASIPDNRILACALHLQKATRRKVVFVTKDLNARVKATALGLKAQDYAPDTQPHVDDLYRGYREIDVDGSVVDAFYADGSIEAPEEMYPNECALLRSTTSPKHSALARHHAPSKTLVPLRYDESHPWRLSPLNMAQHFALEMLLDPEIHLVTLLGRAGTGKTLLALAAALEQVAEKQLYRRALVSRPIIPLGRDIGYLPGSKEEKLDSWMEPIYDNLQFLVDPTLEAVDDKVSYLFDQGWLEVEAVTYIRGRSLPKLFILVDEAQNLSTHEVKTIVSRAGQDSKVVLVGDPFQIDNPYLDATSNGLSMLVESFKAQTLFGHVWLDRSERSTLAALATELL
jgi:PhoH-like ATPase